MAAKAQTPCEVNVFQVQEKGLWKEINVVERAPSVGRRSTRGTEDFADIRQTTPVRANVLIKRESVSVDLDACCRNARDTIRKKHDTGDRGDRFVSIETGDN